MITGITFAATEPNRKVKQSDNLTYTVCPVINLTLIFHKIIVTMSKS